MPLWPGTTTAATGRSTSSPKTRRTWCSWRSLSSPLESVTPQKQRRLILTAQAYLAACPSEKQPRFDVAAVTLEGEQPVGWEYVENAFLT